jgi:hypothetical protein
MTDDRTPMSVRELRLFERRTTEARRRNGTRCPCEHDSTPVVPLCRTKKLGTKRIRLARHGVLHLASCQHSTLAETTATLVLSPAPDPLAGYRNIPTVVIR